MSQPSAEQIAAQKQTQDSLAVIQRQKDSLANAKANVELQEKVATLSDSARTALLSTEFGVFAPAASGSNGTSQISNQVMTVTFSHKGGYIKSVELKEHLKVEDIEGKEIKSKLHLLDDPKNRFSYELPVTGVQGGVIKTKDLYFTPSIQDNTITLRASAGEGKYFEQVYKLSKDNYTIDYAIQWAGLERTLVSDEPIRLDWVNYLDKLEKNTTFERNYSTVYYKPADGNSSYCSCTKSDKEELPEQSFKWVSHANQFFNTTLIAKDRFAGGIFSTQLMDTDAADLKKTTTKLLIPTQNNSFAMQWYVGPNEFERLRAIDKDLTDIIPFGRSLFGAINRWVIRPIFNFLLSFIGSKGIVILILTLVVKLALYPLSYKMIKSQAKMGILKPQLAKLREKYPDDQQKVQMESMKMYQEFGVSPLGGCLPMVAQMPIWFALYRFFPASIEFRQAPFLWATDLSSYDVFMKLPFDIPFFGAHLSLFSLLWAITTLAYTYFNMKDMDMSANPAMKYMQYIMPVMFLGFFNSYASGLTCYLLFSNILNITQTVVTKEYIIDKKKLEATLNANKAKPKKKSGWQDRLQTAMQEQERKLKDQQAAAQKSAASKKKK